MPQSFHGCLATTSQIESGTDLKALNSFAGKLVTVDFDQKSIFILDNSIFIPWFLINVTDVWQVGQSGTSKPVNMLMFSLVGSPRCSGSPKLVLMKLVIGTNLQTPGWLYGLIFKRIYLCVPEYLNWTRNLTHIYFLTSDTRWRKFCYMVILSFLVYLV